MRGNVPLAVAQALQHRHDRRIPLAERHAGALIPLAVLDVERVDALVVLVEELDRVEIRGGEMADVERDADIR